MISRQELFKHKEELWVLCLPSDEGQNHRFSPLVDLVDWYNNQLLMKSLLQKKFSLEAGSNVLVTTSGLLPVNRILVFGLGKAKDLGGPQGKKAAQDLGRVLEELDVQGPWVVLSGLVPAKFAEEFQKSRTSVATLAHATIAAEAME